MAKKTVDPLKAKQARQKKIAIVGGVLFLAVAAFQVPRTLKMLKGPDPLPPAPAAVAAPSAAAPPPTATPVAAGTPAPQPSTARIGVVDPAAPVPVTGQLVSFDRFETKDPFVQQLNEGAPAGGAPAPTPKPGPSPTSGTSVVPPTAAAPASVPPPKPAAPAPTAVPAPTPAAAAPAPAKAPASAVISVNGVQETVALKTDFPKLEPVFRLAALTRTSAKIAIAGGSYATGTQTVTLVRGKPLTLMNTADGTRYELRLLTVA